MVLRRIVWDFKWSITYSLQLALQRAITASSSLLSHYYYIGRCCEVLLTVEIFKKALKQFQMVQLFFLTVLATASLVGAFAPAANNAIAAKTAINTPFQVSPSTQQQSSTALCEMLTQTDLPDKLYFEKEKETPKVLGGLKIGLRKLVVITGASSGLGLNCAVTLAKTGKYFVVMACRDVEKGKAGKFLHFGCLRVCIVLIFVFLLVV